MVDFLSPINAKQIKSNIYTGETYYGGKFIGDGSELTGLDSPYDLAFALTDEDSEITTGETVQIYITRGFIVEKITLVLNEKPTGGNFIVDLKVKRNDSWYNIGEIIVSASTTQGSITEFETEIFEDGDLIKAEVKQIGVLDAGSGAKIYIKGSMNGMCNDGFKKLETSGNKTWGDESSNTYFSDISTDNYDFNLNSGITKSIMIFQKGNAEGEFKAGSGVTLFGFGLKTKMGNATTVYPFTPKEYHIIGGFE